MNIPPKQIFILASGVTGIFATGFVIAKIPKIIIEDNRELTKKFKAQTKQNIKQVKLQEVTKQKQIELDILKLKRKWW